LLLLLKASVGTDMKNYKAEKYVKMKNELEVKLCKIVFLGYVKCSRNIELTL